MPDTILRKVKSVLQYSPDELSKFGEATRLVGMYAFSCSDADIALSMRLRQEYEKLIGTWSGKEILAAADAEGRNFVYNRIHKRAGIAGGLIAVQQEYIDTVNAGIARWAHRPKLQYQIGGGHAGRIAGGAHRRAERKLRAMGFTDKKQITQIIEDARDVAALERLAAE